MKKLLQIIFLNLLFIGFIPVVLLAQISQGGQPRMLEPTVRAGFDALVFEEMPPIDLERLQQEDAVFDYEPVPWRFGENIEVNYSLQNAGKWTYMEDGAAIWRLGIKSQGALSLNLTFDNYRLPPGAELFIYSPDGKHILGAFTDFNNQDDGYFATTLMLTDEIILEYYEPASAAFRGELSLQTVTHGYRGVGDFSRAFGDAGWCNVNVACEESQGWENQINSVVMLVTGSNGFCSGSLINNTRLDGTPYVLSANHCYRTPSTVIFWFNWQSATCENPSSSPSYQSISGGIQKARHTSADFWLMEMSSTPPEEFNPYFAGWNRTDDATITGTVVGIHHPRGDIKKISWANGGVTTSRYGGNTGSGTTHWRLASWSDGTTTEGGSSGSPLYDPQGRIIGQLHGGSAACGNTLPDWYGKLSTSWIGGGTQTTRLSNWLDPDNTGILTLNGFDPYNNDPILGDINEDGVINVQDLVLLIDLILNEKYDPAADFNNTGVVDTEDLVALVHLILEKEKKTNHWLKHEIRDAGREDLLPFIRKSVD